MKNNLDTLLQMKSEVQVPEGIEERIMRRIQNESAATKKTGFGWFIERYSYSAASFAAVVIAVAVLWSNHEAGVQQKNLQEFSEEIYMYNTGNNIFSALDREEKINKGIENIQEYDEYIELLSS